MTKLLDPKKYTKIILRLVSILKRYATTICIVLGLSIFGFLVFRIRTLAAQEPSEDAIAEKVGQKRPISIDPATVKIVQELQQTNVEVKALFDQARNNPFQE